MYGAAVGRINFNKSLGIYRASGHVACSRSSSLMRRLALFSGRNLRGCELIIIFRVNPEYGQ